MIVKTLILRLKPSKGLPKLKISKTSHETLTKRTINCLISNGIQDGIFIFCIIPFLVYKQYVSYMVGGTLPPPWPKNYEEFVASDFP